MAINDGLAYEVDERGERLLVRSVNSDRQAFLRFTNRTSRPVDVWWRDFDGRRRFYERMEPGAFYDINSYLTHPWEFTDSSTRERFVINNKFVFRAPDHVGDQMYRTNWNITVPVRSLRTTTLLALAAMLPSAEAASELDLPVVLSRELKELAASLRAQPESHQDVQEDRDDLD